MDSIRKEIEAEIRRARLDKGRLYDLILKIVDSGAIGGGAGSPGPVGPQGPQGPQGPPSPRDFPHPQWMSHLQFHIRRIRFRPLQILQAVWTFELDGEKVDCEISHIQPELFSLLIVQQLSKWPVVLCNS